MGVGRGLPRILRKRGNLDVCRRGRRWECGFASSQSFVADVLGVTRQLLGLTTLRRLRVRDGGNTYR